MDINDIMKELAQYKRLQDETAAIIEGLTDKLKEYMTANQLDTLTGEEHKATYKTVTSSRIDTTALKRQCRKWLQLTPKPQKHAVSHLHKEVKNMFWICLILFPFVVLAELLKNTK